MSKAAFIERSPNGSAFALYGSSDSVELWSSATMSQTHVLDTHHGSVSHLEFTADTDEFISSGHDGRLVLWTPTGKQKLIAQLNQPIVTFAQARATKTIVFSTADGALWRSDDKGQVLLLKSGGTQITRMIPLPDGASICIGYANGDVVAIDTKSWQQTLLRHISGVVRDIAFTPDGRTVAVATNDIIQVGVRNGDTWDAATTTWISWAARARQLALAPDGLVVAACIDGTVRMYSPVHRTWLSLPTGTADLTLAVMTADGQAGAVLDAEGRILWIDLKAVRTAINDTH